MKYRCEGALLCSAFNLSQALTKLLNLDLVCHGKRIQKHHLLKGHYDNTYHPMCCQKYPWGFSLWSCNTQQPFTFICGLWNVLFENEQQSDRHAEYPGPTLWFGTASVFTGLSRYGSDSHSYLKMSVF